MGLQLGFWRSPPGVLWEADPPDLVFGAGQGIQLGSCGGLGSKRFVHEDIEQQRAQTRSMWGTVLICPVPGQHISFQRSLSHASSLPLTPRVASPATMGSRCAKSRYVNLFQVNKQGKASL